MIHTLPTFAVLLGGVFLFSLVLGEGVRRFAIRSALLDAPNLRSLHVVPTPRLGGVALALSTGAGALMLSSELAPSVRALVVVCLLLALVGLRDDIRPLSSGLRFVFQIVLAASALWILGIPAVAISRVTTIAVPAALTAAALLIWIVGVLNIYNFMDGMDGLAGAQTLFAATALAVVHGRGDVASLLLLVCAATLGFLVHNFPPARMFLGDAGSTFLGMFFASVAVIGMHRGIPLTESALALAPFLLDGTFTILRRARRGERVWEAHRAHLYQRAVASGKNHREVLFVYTVWMCVSAISTIIAHLGTGLTAVAWTVALVALLAIRRWVVTLESDRANLA